MGENYIFRDFIVRGQFRYEMTAHRHLNTSGNEIVSVLNLSDILDAFDDASLCLFISVHLSMVSKNL